MISLDQITIFADGLDHPECIALHPDGSLWAGGEAGQIYRISADGSKVEEISRAPGGFILGIAFSPDASWLAICDIQNRCLHRLDLASNKIDLLAKNAGSHMIEIPNYPCFRRNGDLLVSESGSFSGKTGLVMRFGTDGTSEVWHAAPLQFANGMALNRDETFLYVVESFGNPGVARIRIQKDGSAGACERFCDLPMSVPDGLAFAADGTLYVSCYSPSRIYQVSPSGAVTILADDWTAHRLSNCTNLAFGGPAFDCLYAANVGRWHISSMQLGIRGAELPCHRG